jgi:His-Xaa-Ser system radical SAM maturase HxsC
MLALHGNASFMRGFENAATPLVLRLRAIGSRPSAEEDAALLRDPTDLVEALALGFSGAVIINNNVTGPLSDAPSRVMVLPDRFSYLSEDDIIGINGRTGGFRTLYRRNSKHNSFLITERCNHYCLMCSQPPRDVNDGWILDEIKAALPLIAPNTPSLGFTGGEPLLDWRGLISALKKCRDVLPNTAIHVLSNGRAFADPAVVSAWAGVRHPSLTAGIPIYSAVDHVHDYVVQAKGAFDETVLGILRLKDKRQRVEVRVVLHSITVPLIVETCTWLARNLAFVDHVALMGLENTGFSVANHELLWIDPIEYRELLAAAVDILAAARIKVSVYNLQRCILHPSVWPFAARSISDWKNNYIEECECCIEKERCSGFFSSGRPRHSKAIRAILN